MIPGDPKSMQYRHMAIRCWYFTYLDDLSTMSLRHRISLRIRFMNHATCVRPWKPLRTTSGIAGRWSGSVGPSCAIISTINRHFKSHRPRPWKSGRSNIRSLPRDMDIRGRSVHNSGTYDIDHHPSCPTSISSCTTSNPFTPWHVPSCLRGGNLSLLNYHGRFLFASSKVRSDLLMAALYVHGAQARLAEWDGKSSFLSVP